MQTHKQTGPYKVFTAAGGQTIPLYLVTFDKDGNCQAPETVDTLRDIVKTASDVYVFSHGWNNDFNAATALYENFIGGYMHMRESRKLVSAADYKPVLIGIIWPSAILVKEDEEPPKFLSARTENDDFAREIDKLISDVSGKIDVNESVFLAQCLKKKTLDSVECQKLSEIVVKTYNDENDEVKGEKLNAEILQSSWSTMEKALDEDPFADMWMNPGEQMTAGAVADLVNQISVKNVLRTFTVWQMKDRAGLVGKTGVHQLLVQLMDGSDCRIHVIGHSYGTKVVLSAIAAGELPRPVRSALLLQGAVSHLCFADNVNASGKPGGFNKALSRIELPILSTYSEHDFPLTQVFHLALRRSRDLGEALATNLEKPPSVFAALGGYGPRSVGGSSENLQKRIPIRDVMDPYNLDKSIQIYGLDGTRKISGHGDVSNESTWWALYNLVSSKL